MGTGKKLFIIAIGVFCQIVFADSMNSAVRYPNETYQEAYQRFLKRSGALARPVWGSSAQDAAVAIQDLDASKFPVVQNIEDLFKGFRDARFLDDRSHASFKRRNTWLYPYDGCWIRATLAGNIAEAQGYARPAKLFIFGNLSVDSKFSTSGNVSWWYHVIPAVKDAAGKLYALDPAIESERPLTVEEWVLTMVPNVSKAKLAICHPKTYGPGDSCDSPSNGSGSSAESDISWYMDAEWTNVRDLGHKPEEILGDNPPWLN